MNTIYKVDGMSCIICKNTVEKTLNKIDGVNKASVNLLDNEVLIDYDENKVPYKLLEQEIKKAGYTLSKKKNENKTNLIKLIFSIILSILLMSFMFTQMSQTIIYIEILISVIVVILNFNIIKSGISALVHLNPNMNSLVTISALSAFIYSIINIFIFKNEKMYFETTTMVLTIVSIGKYIEKGTKSKATSILRGLSTLIPMEANLKDGDSIKTIPISELKKGNTVLIKAGDSIPQDGEIIKGNALVNESMINGESLPIYKKEKDTVIGGSVLMDGTIEVLITSVASNTILSNIISETKSSLTKKIKIEKLADLLSKYFVYGVLIISIITFIIWYLSTKNFELSINFSLSVMLISCPCALGLATPAAIYVASSNASKNGILIKNPEVLEILYKTKYIVFDKTGTITENKLHIENEEIFSYEFIDIICSLESYSNHPIAKTITTHYNYKNIEFDKVEELKGEGVQAYKNNSLYYVSNIKNLKEKGITIKPKYNEASLIIGLIKDHSLLGLIYLNDVLRDSSIDAINNLKERNIDLTLATGDSHESVAHLDQNLRFNAFISESKPENKNEIINSYKEKGITMMVGDGINDAIALSNANISISVKDASDIASATSDIVLINNDLNSISYLIDLSKKTMRIIKQNLLWALFYNAIFIPLAAGLLYNEFKVALTPIIGTITMSISSIIVLMNALRINKVKKEIKNGQNSKN